MLRLMTRARIGLQGMMWAVLITFVANGCGKLPDKCDSTCKDVSGTYTVDSSLSQGQCDFTPYTLPPAITLTATSVKTMTTQVIDQVNRGMTTLSGTIYKKASSDPSGTLVSFSVQAQTSRLATAGSSKTVNLVITMSGSVVNDTKSGNWVVSGTLTTANIPSGTNADGTPVAYCQTTVSFSASMPAP